MKNFLLPVPLHDHLRLKVVLRSARWVAEGVRLAKGFQAGAWFLGGDLEVGELGTIAISEVNLNYVAHECLHAAYYLVGAKNEERLANMTGLLTELVWEALNESF